MEKVIDQITVAFNGVHFPGSQKLLHFPDTGNDLWIESFLDCKFSCWQEVPAELIEYECSALTAFSPKAFIFFIPAYMTWVLKNYEKSDSSTVDHTLYGLDLTSRDKNSKSIMLERFEPLSLMQKKSVFSFLNLLKDKKLDNSVDIEAAKRALDSYWGKFENEI